MKHFVMIATVFVLSCFLLHLSSTASHGEEGGEGRKSLIASSFLQWGHSSAAEEDVSAIKYPPAAVEITEDSIKLSNGFVLAEFNRNEPSLRHLAGGEGGGSRPCA